MKHWIHLASITTFLLLSFSGCNSGPQTPETPQIDITLPTPSINGHISDMNAIAFEWKPIENSNVVGIYVYRSSPENKDEKLHRIDSINNRYATHYVDTTVKPGNAYMYRFATYNKEKKESRGSETIRTSTTQLLHSVSYFKSVGNMPRIAKLLWRPHTNTKVNRYILEKSTLENPEWKPLVTIEGRLNAEYIDQDLEDNAVYKYRLISVTFDGLQSTPSDIVKVVTKPLPLPVKNLQASNNLPKKIALNWQTTDIKDFSHYNIYRSDKAEGNYDYHVKLTENTFTDKIDEDGKSYFYKVTVVDHDQLESRQPEVAVQGTTLPRPAPPSFLEASLRDNKVILSWQRTDDRSNSFVIIKTTHEGFFKKTIEEVYNITDTKYVDVAIKPDTLYSYQIISVDENSIRSNPTKVIEIESKAK